MASCLGMYIENNLIKYAKVTKERENLKVDSFGVKFYDQIGPAINQIISETYSYKTPISINLSEETYQYFYFFNLLNKTDLKRAIDTEFESYCYDKGYNRNALETRYALMPDMQDNEKIKAIYMSVNKAEINKRAQEFNGNAISYILPLPMSIPSIADIKEKDNIAIVNIEESTTVTTILKNQIYNIDKIEEGMGPILETISAKENSYAKAYEICKNTTIYTMEGRELLQEEENMYLEDIMPTLYSIIQKVQEIVDNSLERIDKIYITGTGCVINNIDLYFQEYFNNVKCEILKPYFIPDNVKINMKDYIEVNSAISLAMQGLGYGIKGINFRNPTVYDKLPEWLKMNKNSNNPKDKKSIKIGNFSISNDWNAKLDGGEKVLLRTAITLLSFVVIYSGLAVFISKETENKIQEVSSLQKDTEAQISLAGADIQKLNNRASDYKQRTESLKSYREQINANMKAKNEIPFLLTKIEGVIPKGVTITSIENTTGSHIVINAQSAYYDLLGFFKGSIISEGVLSPSTVVSTSGEKQSGIIRVVIEGDLP